MKRRDFLTQSIYGIAALSGVQMFNLSNHFAHAAVNRSKKLFVVFLRGGMDGLSVFPSVARLSTIRELRQNMHDDNLFDPFVGASGYGSTLRVHKELSVLNSSGVAIFPHAGSLNPSKSHFDQMKIIEGGDINKVLGTGYLGRALNMESDLRSVAVSPSVPMSLRGADPLVIPSASSLDSALELRNPASLLRVGFAGTNSDLNKRLKFLSGASSLSDCGNNRNCKLSHEAANALSQVDVNVTTSSPFELAAAISSSTYSPQILTLDVGGWDIHNNGKSRMITQLQELNEGLTLLKQRLTNQGSWNDSVVVVMSEFGRTISVNGAGGVDHGRGGVMFVMGGRVKPQANSAFTRDWGFDSNSTQESGPSQCFRVKTDYRDVLAHVMIDHLNFPQSAVIGSGAQAVFPSHTNYRSPMILG